MFIEERDLNMRITESKLRSIIRSVIAETIEDPEHGTLYQMPDGSYAPADVQDDYYNQDRETEEEAEEYDDYYYSEDYVQYMDDWARQNPYRGDED